VAHSYPPKSCGFFDFYGNHHNAFNGATAALTALLDAAYKGFVNFNVSRKMLTFGINHSHPKAMQHSPCDAIFRSQGAL
jgi:hypothetical protein